MSRTSYDPDWIPPPGATIEDLLSRLSNPRPLRSVIVNRLGETQTKMLLNGQFQIDADLADFLAQSVGMSTSFWLERERLYRSALLQRQSEKQILEGLPLDEMRKRTLIKPLTSHAETMAEVVEFFGSEDSESCGEHIQRLPALIKQKTSRTIVSRPGSLAVWVRAGEIEASGVECAIWNRERLQQMLPEFRTLTRVEDPRRYLPALRGLFQRCGIAFVVMRTLSGCSARGVVKFMSPPTKAMMMLSYRHLSNDQFWFSVFHELAHLLLHAEDETILDDWDDSVTAKEYEADRFAADTLIPPDRQRELSSLRDDRSIIGFAQSIGVSRGIVVGQMQHHGIIGHERFNHLKTFYQWNDKNQVEKRSR